jgi:hypothetical protein
MRAKLVPDVWGKAGANLAGELQALALEIPNEQRINPAPTIGSGASYGRRHVASCLFR